MSDEEKMEIIKLHHLEGVSQCELARRYDTRQPVVSRIISKFAAENNKVYTVCYTVDGVTHHLTLIGDDAWHDFMNRMFALAEEGHEVSFRNEETASRVVSTKDVVTYSTKDRDKAFAWADAMVEEGYTVTVRFDENTGIYTCYAIK